MYNFDVRIRGDADAGYQVEVTASPAGETPAAVAMASPLQQTLGNDVGAEHSQATVESTLRDLQDFRADPATVGRLGDALWHAAFQPPIASRYAESLGMAGDEGLRVRLRVDPGELQLLPWEYLHNPETEQFLALSRRTPLVRYVARPQPVAPLSVEGPLRVLVLISAPMDQEPLRVEHERQLIEDGLHPLVESGEVELAVETDARLDRLQERVRQGFQVLHYIGHGLLTRGQGYLVLEDDSGTSRFVGAAALEPLLGETSLRCVVLTACESSAAPGDPFLGLAPALVRGGVPAVVAMQMSMPDDSAVVFSREFYRSLAHRLPIDACVTEGRLGIRAAVRDTRVDWGIPTLFTRSDDGVILAGGEDARVGLGRGEGTAERSGGVDIRDSSVTVEGDIAGRDIHKVGMERSPETKQDDNLLVSIWSALRRFLGGQE